MFRAGERSPRGTCLLRVGPSEPLCPPQLLAPGCWATGPGAAQAWACPREGQGALDEPSLGALSPALLCFWHWAQQTGFAWPSDTSRRGSPGPARHSDLLLLRGRVVALGLSFHFPVTGQRVAAWCRLDSISREVLARFPPTQVDTRGTPQLRGQRCEGCEHVTGPSPNSQTRPDSASGWGPLRASPPILSGPGSPSWWGPSPPEGGSTRGQARSSSCCPLGPHWDSAATTGRSAVGTRPGAAQARGQRFSSPSLQNWGSGCGHALYHPPYTRAVRPAAPACTWPAGSSRRPAAARRRCARARAPGGTAPASAPAWRRRCSRWAGRTIGYTQCLVPAGSTPSPGSSPSWTCPVFSWLLPQLVAHLMRGWLSPALGLETTPSTCPRPAGRPAVPVTKGQCTFPPPRPSQGNVHNL